MKTEEQMVSELSEKLSKEIMEIRNPLTQQEVICDLLYKIYSSMPSEQLWREYNENES